ncbi:snRNA-activating protein complex subunit 4 [Galleria mellonella]|uniref:snRNA-activating protein complex subunit 4 n=1 Tax=Galleria mellonella TaxID=7137 RepID=A0ABM3MN50_GALME|nr:snRNA-activating protein complex subunit 4 [Galleria mellonella]
MDIDSDEETEIQLKELKQLTAVLEADDVPVSNDTTSQCSNTLSSFPISSLKGQKYSKIEMALALNKYTDEKLQRLERMLHARLQECKLELLEIDTNAGKQERVESFHYINCGRPYFKDKDNYPAPSNEDTILMQEAEMFDFYSVVSVPGWTVKDKSEFLGIILKMSQTIRTFELNSQIAQVRREIKFKKIQSDKTLQSLNAKLNVVNKLPLKDIALPIDQEYDWETIANKLNHRHTAQEYRSLWKLFLHPSINKNSWTKTEHTNLQTIAYDHSLQDWDKIAQELKSNRTGYQCFVYFRTNMNNNFTGQKWTKEEEEYLKRLIEYYKEDEYIPWGKVAAAMENRTKIQVYNKYFRLIEQRKGRFLPEEDTVILTCVDNFGPNFKRIKKYLPSRSVIQLRNRYHLLNKKSISIVWTVAEDKKLIQLMANQDSSINYSSISSHFPGKDRGNLRARYITLKKWMRQNPNTDIALAPRRGARRLTHGRVSQNLNKAIEKLKNRIQIEVNTKKSNRITEESSEQEIEDAIIAALATESINEEESNSTTDDVVVQGESEGSVKNLNVTNLHYLLMLLKANLNKNKFTNSIYFDKYSALVDKREEVNEIKIKSYSKKNKIKTITIGDPPDIWGNTTFHNVESVLPPHYATIIGCRILISNFTKKIQCKNNVKELARKNAELNKQMNILMERFNILFLWPLLISNEIPSPKLYSDKLLLLRKSNIKAPLPAVPGITIPSIQNLTINNEVIDLKQAEGKEEVTLEVNFQMLD